MILGHICWKHDRQEGNVLKHASLVRVVAVDRYMNFQGPVPAEAHLHKT